MGDWYEYTHKDETVAKNHIVDSGERREFDSGAVRDIQTGKGRCDLLPLAIVARVLGSDIFLAMLDKYVRYGDEKDLVTATRYIGHLFDDEFTAILEVSKHFEDGCVKYGERNWEKGIPAHSFVDSAVRHYIKMLRGDEDERHDRACLWNLLCLHWTVRNKPEYNDLPQTKGEILQRRNQ